MGAEETTRILYPEPDNTDPGTIATIIPLLAVEFNVPIDNGAANDPVASESYAV